MFARVARYKIPQSRFGEVISARGGSSPLQRMRPKLGLDLQGGRQGRGTADDGEERPVDACDRQVRTRGEGELLVAPPEALQGGI